MHFFIVTVSSIIHKHYMDIYNLSMFLNLFYSPSFWSSYFGVCTDKCDINWIVRFGSYGTIGIEHKGE